MTTPERKAEIKVIFEEVCGRTSPPKPKVVVREDLGTIRDADVPVSPADKNWPALDDEGFVRVRRPGYVTIDIPLWEKQQAEKRAEKRRYKRFLKELDPCRLGLYGTIDEDE
jgi:hypothetical protein